MSTSSSSPTVRELAVAELQVARETESVLKKEWDEMRAYQDTHFIGPHQRRKIVRLGLWLERLSLDGQILALSHRINNLCLLGSMLPIQGADDGPKVHSLGNEHILVPVQVLIDLEPTEADLEKCKSDLIDLERRNAEATTTLAKIDELNKSTTELAEAYDLQIEAKLAEVVEIMRKVLVLKESLKPLDNIASS